MMMTSKFQFSVCSHDVAKDMASWSSLNMYLQKNLGCDLRFEPRDDFDQELEAVLQGSHHLVYASPYSAIVFAKRLGFIPLAKPVDSFDETLVIARKDFVLTNAREVKIAVASSQMIVHVLGLMLLRRMNLSLERCDFDFVGTHANAAHAVTHSADLAFVYHDTWSDLTDAARNTLQIVAQTDNRLAFHCFCVAPEWQDKRERLQGVLCGMQNDFHGKSILGDLHVHGFEPLAADALEPLNQVFEELGITPE